MDKSIVIRVPTLDRVDLDRRISPLDYYVPHVGQLRFHGSGSKIRAIFGGNRSGKTEAGGAETVLTVTGSQRFRPIRRQRSGTVWVASESSEVQREVTQPKLMKWLPDHLIKHISRVQRGIFDFIELKNGWSINFKNYEQTVDKWAGKDVDLLWYDEEPPYDIWIEGLMRTIDRGGCILLTMTPVKGMTWVYSHIWEKHGIDGIECFLMDMDDNPYLSDSEKRIVLAGLTEQEKKIRKEGRFVALHGLVYPKFDERKHVCASFDIPKDWLKVVSIDPHLKKPTSILWGALAGYRYQGIEKGDWVIYRELKRDGIIPDICASILVANGRDRIKAYIADPALNIKDNLTGVNVFDEFANYGLALIPANKHVEAGIHEIRKMLDETPSGIHIFDNCQNLIWEFRHYSFSDIDANTNKSYSEKILKREDDMLDSLRYMVNSGLRPVRGGYMESVKYNRTETGRIKGVICG